VSCVALHVVGNSRTRLSVQVLVLSPRIHGVSLRTESSNIEFILSKSSERSFRSPNSSHAEDHSLAQA